MATINAAKLIETYAKKHLGFNDNDIQKITCLGHLTAMVKAKNCFKDIPDITKITNSVQADAVCAGITNMTKVAWFSDKSQITALNLGYDINTAVTFDNEYKVLACFLSNNAPSCKDFSKAVQLKALTLGIEPDFALKVTTDVHIAALLAGAKDDAFKFTRQSQVEKLLKGSTVEQVLNYDKQAVIEDILTKLGVNLPHSGLLEKYSDVANTKIDALSGVVVDIDLEGDVTPTDTEL